MKIEFFSEKLKKVLSLAERFLGGKNSTLPTLQGVLFLIENNKVTIRATNLEIGFESVIQTKTQKNGSFVVLPQVLSNILTTIQDQKIVSIEEEKGNILFTGGGNKAVIKCFPVDDFPTLPQKPKENEILIEKNNLLNGLKSVVFSAAISNIKPEISSVYMYPEGKTVVFVATDSVRLAEKKILTKNNQEFSSLILPLKTAMEIIKVCETDEETGDVLVYHNENQISFIFKNTHISSRLVSGNFPDYRQIIPKTNTTEVTTLKNDVLNALKIANAFSDKFHKVLFLAQTKQKQVSLISENPDVGRNETILDAVLEGEPIEIGFNQKHIIDCLGVIPQDSVTLGFSGQGKPLVIKGVGDTSFLYLIAPLST